MRMLQQPPSRHLKIQNLVIVYNCFLPSFSTSIRRFFAVLVEASIAECTKARLNNLNWPKSYFQVCKCQVFYAAIILRCAFRLAARRRQAVDGGGASAAAT